jgi:two-component system response regulator VicR
MASPAKVLIVDDDVTLHEMYAERLRAEGYTIIDAYDGEEALEKIYAEKPDLVVLDIMMPKINGIDVMKKVREDASYTTKTAIILVTALVQEINKIKTMMKDYDQYLVKSEIVPANLIEAIEKSLSVARGK